MITPFTAKWKKGTNTGEGDDNTENKDLLDIESSDNIEAAENNNEFELDVDRKTANIATIEEVIEEIEQEYNLTEKEVHLGCAAVTKVCCNILHYTTLY